jgi:hypothetical protein
MDTVIRCSSTDRALACASSLAPTEYPYNPNSDEAREGTAGHEVLAELVDGSTLTIEDLAAKHGVDQKSLEILAAMGGQAWDKVKHLFDDPRTECPVMTEIAPEVILRGTADLLNLGGELIVADWKLGWTPSEHPAQLKSYALCASQEYGMPADGIVRAFEVWVRLGEIRSYEFSEDVLLAHRDELLDQVDKVGKQYGPGAVACKYCPHQNHCQARDEWLRASCSALAVIEPSGTLDMPRVLGALYDESRALSTALKTYDKALEAVLSTGDKTIPLPGGRVLTLETTDQERLASGPTLDWALEQGFSDVQMGSLFSASKSGLEAAVKANAPKGKGASWVRDAFAELKTRGAIETVKTTRKKITRQA